MTIYITELVTGLLVIAGLFIWGMGKDGEDGAYAMGHEDGKDKTAIAVMKAIRAAGIKVKE